MFKASRKSIRKNSNDISLKPLRLTLNNLCSRNILQRLFQLGDNNNYIANTKTQVTKDLFEISSKKFRTDSHKVVFKSFLLRLNNLFLRFFLGFSLKMLLLGCNNDYVAVAKTQVIKTRSKSKIKNIRRTSKEIILKSLQLTLHTNFFRRCPLLK